MSGFLYSIQQAAAVSKKMIEEAGLGGVFKGLYSSVVQTQCFDSPGGGPAVVFMGAGGSAERCRYEKERQRWVKKVARDSCLVAREESGNERRATNNDVWIGYWKDDPPKEHELRRKVQLGGHRVELTENEEWLIPVARHFAQGSVLPKSMLLGSNGEIVKELLPQYAGFGSRVERFWEDIQRQNGWLEGEPVFTEKQQWELAAEAVGLNYHIGVDEINMLSLFTEQNVGELLSAVVDWQSVKRIADSIAEAHKKKQDAGMCGQ